jgi:hypothetical protein
LNDPAWQATLRVERLPQSIQADVVHLFSIGEGIAYGSSVLNYVVSGAPISVLKVDLSAEYFNVEFTGKDIRSWQKSETGYVVQLHSPVSGAYTLLATYERPFKAQGETLAFTGVRPLDAQSEQGYTIVVSAYQFQVQPVEVAPGLVPLETGEVPSEYRLLFNAPVLAAYRYAARPVQFEIGIESPRPRRLSEPGCRSCDVDHTSLEGRPGANKCAILREEPRQLELSRESAGWNAVVVCHGKRGAGRPRNRRRHQPRPPARSG